MMIYFSLYSLLKITTLAKNNNVHKNEIMIIVFSEPIDDNTNPPITNPIGFTPNKTVLNTLLILPKYSGFTLS